MSEKGIDLLRISPTETQGAWVEEKINSLDQCLGKIESPELYFKKGRMVLSANGRRLADQIYQEVLPDSNGENADYFGTVAGVLRREIREELAELRSGFKLDLKGEWEAEGRKYRGQAKEFKAELKEKLEKDERYRKAVLKRRIIASIEQKEIRKRKERIKAENLVREIDEGLRRGAWERAKMIWQRLVKKPILGVLSGLAILGSLTGSIRQRGPSVREVAEAQRPSEIEKINVEYKEPEREEVLVDTRIAEPETLLEEVKEVVKVEKMTKILEEKEIKEIKKEQREPEKVEKAGEVLEKKNVIEETTEAYPGIEGVRLLKVAKTEEIKKMIANKELVFGDYTPTTIVEAEYLQYWASQPKEVREKLIEAYGKGITAALKEQYKDEKDLTVFLVAGHMSVAPAGKSSLDTGTAADLKEGGKIAEKQVNLWLVQEIAKKLSQECPAWTLVINSTKDGFRVDQISTFEGSQVDIRVPDVEMHMRAKFDEIARKGKTVRVDVHFNGGENNPRGGIAIPQSEGRYRQESLGLSARITDCLTGVVGRTIGDYKAKVADINDPKDPYSALDVGIESQDLVYGCKEVGRIQSRLNRFIARFALGTSDTGGYEKG